MSTEADACRKFVVPKLQAAGWDSGREAQFTRPDVLKLPPISNHGKVNGIIGKFGGANQLRNAVNRPQSLLYAA